MTDESRPRRRRTIYAASAAAFRWLHIYLSMLGFATLMFFAFTGITLNHPDWFGASDPVIRDVTGSLPSELIPDGSDVENGELSSTGDRLTEGDVDEIGIAEWLRAEHRLSGKVSEFSVDDFEIMVVFKGPGYVADVFIDREQGSYSLAETASGSVAILNDLHKGRDSGSEWSWVIDVSAVLTMLLSLSGFGLLFYLKRRRVSGVLTAVFGTVALVGVWAVFVP